MKHIVSEGDLVVVHSLFRTGPNGRGQAIMDLFRLEHGQIVEHWEARDVSPGASPYGIYRIPVI